MDCDDHLCPCCVRFSSDKLGRPENPDTSGLAAIAVLQDKIQDIIEARFLSDLARGSADVGESAATDNTNSLPCVPPNTPA